LLQTFNETFYFQMGFPQQGGYFMPAIPQPQRFFSQGQANMRPGMGQPRWPQQGRGAGGSMMNMQNQFRGPRPGGARMNQPMIRPMAGQPMMPIMAARPGMPPQAMAQLPPQMAVAVSQNQRGAAANYKYGPNVRNQAQVTKTSAF
jgi:hypothetical protein